MSEKNLIFLLYAILLFGLIVNDAITHKQDSSTCALIVPEDEAARQRKVADEIERHQYIADRQRAWEIVAKEWTN